MLILKALDPGRRSDAGSHAHSEGPEGGSWKAWGRIRHSLGRPGDGSGAHREGLGTDPPLIGTAWERILCSFWRSGAHWDGSAGGSGAHREGLGTDPALNEIGKASGRMEVIGYQWISPRSLQNERE